MTRLLAALLLLIPTSSLAVWPDNSTGGSGTGTAAFAGLGAGTCPASEGQVCVISDSESCTGADALESGDMPAVCIYTSEEGGASAWRPIPVEYVVKGTSYLYPFNTGHGIAIGTDAAEGDKDIRLPSTGPIYSESGYDAPVTLPKWHRITLSTDTTTWGGDAANKCLVHSGASGPLTIANANFPKCATRLASANAVRFGRYSFQIIANATGLDASDTYVFNLYGCAFGASATFPTGCTIIQAAILTVSDGASEVAGVETEGSLLSVGTIAANTYDYLIVAADSSVSVDPANNTSISISGWVDVEN